MSLINSTNKDAFKEWMTDAEIKKKELKEKEDELAEHIASKIDIPFVSEKDETALAKGVISAVSDILHGLGNQKKK